MKKHLLFVCSMAQDRSKKASEFFKNNVNYEAKYTGIHELADIKLDSNALIWADSILVMEFYQKAFILERFSKEMKGKDIIVLDIDDYSKEDPELKRLLLIKLTKEGFL